MYFMASGVVRLTDSDTAVVVLRGVRNPGSEPERSLPCTNRGSLDTCVVVTVNGSATPNAWGSSFSMCTVEATSI